MFNNDRHVKFLKHLGGRGREREREREGGREREREGEREGGRERVWINEFVSDSQSVRTYSTRTHKAA